MFEKEAKERAKDYTDNAKRQVAYECGFLDGVDLGYNKANEWHYVKDGKYPTDEKDVQVMYQDCDKINVYNCIYDTHAENWLYYNLDDMILELFPFTVIAWKKIILPKESVMTKEECEIETSKAIMEMRNHIEDLEKENAELDCQKNRNKFCYSCANAEDRCFRNEIGCPCEKYKSYKEDNAELKRGYHYKAEVINGRPTGKAILISDSLAYAKSIIKDLLNNSDEYAKQRAREFLEENLK